LINAAKGNRRILLKMDNDTPPSSDANTQIELAKIRTALALDRTLLAWIRTSLTFITFGFGLAKFMVELQRDGHLHGFGTGTLDSPKVLGLTMMVLGLAGLGGGAVDYWGTAKILTKTDLSVSPFSSSFLVAIALSIITLFLMIALVLQTTP
jgi:bile acid:Na+ symporter, BASS family